MEIRYSQKADKRIKKISREIEKDKIDYYSAIGVRWKNKKWTKHGDLKKELGI